MDPIRLKYQERIWRDGEWYVAAAWPVDLVTDGTSVQDAKAKLQEAVELFLEGTEEMGTTVEVLEECGYRIKDGTWVPPEVSTSEAVVTVAA